MPLRDEFKLELARKRRLYVKICRKCGARNPPTAEKCRRCKSKNLRWKKMGTKRR